MKISGDSWEKWLRVYPRKPSSVNLSYVLYKI
jgi:hypothetical protein